jgi:hypothetical protein
MTQAHQQDPQGRQQDEDLPPRLTLFVIVSCKGTCLRGRVVFPDQAEYAGHDEEAPAIHPPNGEPMPYASPGELARHETIHGRRS